MFTGINVCVFEAKPCSQGLIFAVSSGLQTLVSYLGTGIMFAWYLFLRFKDGREICQINPLQTLMNCQYLNWFDIHYVDMIKSEGSGPLSPNLCNFSLQQ